jgi:TraR antiactivator
MTFEGSEMTSDIDLRPLVGLLANESEDVIETLTIGAIKKHRKLVDHAEQMFQLAQAGEQGNVKDATAAHLAYLNATIEMHAQMSALTTLLTILGRTPKV